MSSEEDKPDTASDELVSQFLAFTGSSDPNTATNYLEMSGNVLDTAVGLYFEHQGAGGGSGRSSSGGGSGGGSTSATRGTGMPSSSSTDFGSSDFGSYAAATGGGGSGSGDIIGEDGVRAPDASRRMRLLDFDNDSRPGAASAMAAMNHPAALLASGMLSGGGMDHDVDGMMSAFSTSGPAVAGASASGSSGLGIDLTGAGGPGVFDARAAVNAAAASSAANNGANGEGSDSGDNKDDSAIDDATAASIRSVNRAATLSDLFSPPTNIMHRGGGFQGARNVARDSRRWLVVNIQSDSEFACHALNRDVWRDDLVEGLIKEGFIFWQCTDTLSDGQTYVERYKVDSFPHVAIIDPRTARLMWRKEGWTQANPMTATQFAEIAADFCSRHSFDKPPVAPRQTEANGTSAAARPAKRPMHELTEQQQLQAAIAASMNDGNGDDNEDAHDDDHDDDDADEYIMDEDDDDDVVMDSDEEVVIDDDDEVECVGSNMGGTAKPAAATATEEAKEGEKKPPSLEEELATMDVGDEPAGGDVARIQIRMPDGKRLVRKFRGSDTVKVIYAFVAQSNEEAKSGKSFGLKAGFPPRDLKPDIDSTIKSCGLAGEAITVRW
eukprot:CAMPEP_0185740090 /NCGR_PEP_ID=MMETSP1171-20130828/36969_1 /TAXON_ID=374046 /ORGANISM="Helicotheca tamensis, Strain CCMP826" /LENGTH=608 /DNA_ID=CAMNT_0028411843 /DNA_START=294 /DNA_END=2117 /DNA_ORIENTATION=+